jgi:hydrogenase maturation factor
MKDSGLQLESRFSLAPNSLGFCGQKSAVVKFKKCISSNKCDGAKEELKNFIVLYPYLKTLSKILKKPFFSYSVIESYWLGNDELKKAKLKDYSLLLDNFAKQGVPDFFIQELRAKKPKKFIPNHLFHVLFIGVGKASGAVPFNLESINNCMIRWGKVIKLSKKEAIVNLNSLKKNANSGYALTQIKAQIPFDLKFTPDLKVGDMVVVHWNLIVKILTLDEEKNLEFWSAKVYQLFP